MKVFYTVNILTTYGTLSHDEIDYKTPYAYVTDYTTAVDIAQSLNILGDKELKKLKIIESWETFVVAELSEACGLDNDKAILKKLNKAIMELPD